MTGDVRVENLHIENVFVVPGAAPEDFTHDIFTFLKDQVAAGADPKIMGEDGYPEVGEVAEPDDLPTPEQQEELDQARAEALAVEYASPDVTARAGELRGVVKHVTRARRLEGYKKSYKHSPKDHEALDKRHKNSLEVAGMALERACARCIFNNDCVLAGNTELWIDVHPYKDDRTGKRRPGSRGVEAVESRTVFLKELAAGVEADKQIHCDPAERS